MPGMTPYIQRREPVQTIIGDYVALAGRFGEEIAPHSAPDPVRRSDFNTRLSKMVLAAFINPFERFQQIDALLGRRYHDHPLARVPDGRQLSWRERANIRRPNAQSYGSKFEVQ